MKWLCNETNTHHVLAQEIILLHSGRTENNIENTDLETLYLITTWFVVCLFVCFDTNSSKSRLYFHTDSTSQCGGATVLMLGGHTWLVATTVGGVGLCSTLPPPACHTARVAMISCLASLCPTFPVCRVKIATPDS